MDEELDRSSLSADEQRVMEGAIESSELEGVWASYLPAEDTFNYERAYLYVPALSLAARHLIELDYVGISVRETPDGEYVHLAKADAVDAVTDGRDWGIKQDSGSIKRDSGSDGDIASGGTVQAAKYFFYLPDRERLIVNFVDPPQMDYIDDD